MTRQLVSGYGLGTTLNPLVHSEEVLGNKAFFRRLSIRSGDHIIPDARDAYPDLPLPDQVIPINAITGMTMMTRKDDQSKAPLLELELGDIPATDNLPEPDETSEATEADERRSPTQMLYHVEYIVPGVQLVHGFRTVYPVSDLELVTERGRPEAKVEWGKGAVKPIDNRITAWRVYHYVWLAEVRDEARLRQLLEVLKFQGMGKKHTAGFGKIHSYDIQPLPAGVNIEQKLFLERNGELILLRPLPYDAIMSASRRIVMTNLVIESGCGYQPPYWDKRRVVVREGTLFKFAT